MPPSLREAEKSDTRVKEFYLIWSLLKVPRSLQKGDKLFCPSQIHPKPINGLILLVEEAHPEPGVFLLWWHCDVRPRVLMGMGLCWLLGGLLASSSAGAAQPREHLSRELPVFVWPTSEDCIVGLCMLNPTSPAWGNSEGSTTEVVWAALTLHYGSIFYFAQWAFFLCFLRDLSPKNPF